jgi:formate hydrogenlyase subunit 6/NADH:ubiquinone oxidoreductase subunit I
MNAKESIRKRAKTAVKEEKQIASKLIPIYIMGKRYEVPEGLTIMRAMEYAGYILIRGCGCRGGTCGACGTFYRKPGDYKLQVALACQITASPEEIFQLYPELFRCVACNSCTKACPQGIEVMDAISALKQGNIAEAAELSFDCIQCGLCTSRCFGELAQYHMFQLARRIHGARTVPRAEHLAKMVKAVSEGKYDRFLEGLKRAKEDELKKLYKEREVEPMTAGDDWKPEDTTYL